MRLLKLAKRIDLFRLLLQLKKGGKVFLVVLPIWILWVVFWAWTHPFNAAPDECLHLKTAQFFQTHRGFPIANKDEITFIHEGVCKGTSYISTPFLNYIIAGHFISLGNQFGIERDYLAARMSSVFFGIIFLVFFYRFLKQIFKSTNYKDIEEILIDILDI